MMKKTTLALALLLVAGVVTGAAAAGKDPSHGFLGVSIATVEHSHGGAAQDGLFVARIYPGSGAEVAGLQLHDRIAAIGASPVASMDDVQAALAGTRPGDRVEVAVLRDGRSESFHVTLGEAPHGHGGHGTGSATLTLTGDASLDIADGKHLIELHETGPRLGVQVQALGPQLADYFGVDGGLLITEVAEASGARDAGIRAGDVILDVEGTAIRRTADIRHALQDRRPGDAAEVTVQGRDGIQTLTVTLSEPASVPGEMLVELAPVGVSVGDSATIDLGELHETTLLHHQGKLHEMQTDREHLEAEIRRLEGRLDELRAKLRDLDD